MTSNQNIDFDPISKMFKDRDRRIEFEKRSSQISNAQIMSKRQNIMNNSVKAKKEERKIDVIKISKDKFIKVISGLLVICTISTAAITLKIDNAVDNATNYSTMYKASKEIGALVNEGSIYYEPYSKVSIVSQNTYMLNGHPCYDQNGIAKDLLALDDYIFEYAFCCVCNDMGNNIYNKVGSGGRTNIDDVINCMKIYSSSNSSLQNSYVAKLLENVNGLDDFLTKYQYVDKDGNPSLEVFEKVMGSKSNQILAALDVSERKK